MKANSKRKVFGDAVDLLMGDMEALLRLVPKWRAPPHAEIDHQM